MKALIKWLIITVFAAALLTACAEFAPGDSAEEKEGATDGTVSSEVEPDEQPPPEEKSGTDHAEVTWAEAVELLSKGEVQLVSQAHNLEVSLLLKNGRTVTTVQPQIDAILDAIVACGEECSNIVIVSE